MSRRILKFGGSSLAGIDQIDAAALRVAEAVRAGVQPLVVVSAVAGTTNRLLHTARAVHPDPPGEELDRLLATGETQAAALLAMSLGKHGLRARSFTGWEAGLRTDDAFGHARILEVDTAPLISAQEAGEIPVVAGFQGRTADGRVTTLGRGGSDLTAVVLGLHFAADRVVFYRDVDGVFSADPKLLPSGSQRLERLDYEAMIDLAEAGVPILHPQSLEIARAHSQELELRSIRNGSGGTLVCEGPCASPMPVWSVSLSHEIGLLTLDRLPRDMGLVARLMALLDRTDLPVDAELHPSDQGLCLLVQLPDLDGPSVQRQLTDFLREESQLVTSLERNRRRVTLVGRGVGSRRVSMAVERVGSQLGPPLATFRGPHHRAFVVPEHEGRSWLTSLHHALIKV